MTADRITPTDIDAVHFSNSGLFRTHGYNETEVDDYLDELGDQVAADMRRIAELEHTLAEIRTVARDAKRRGKSVGERALAAVVLDYCFDASAWWKPLPDDEAASIGGQTSHE